MTDQELIGYLDRSFGELSRKVDEKIDGLREELREEIRQTRTSLQDENRQTRVALDEARTSLQEENRQTRVMMEGMRSELQLVAEGVVSQGEFFAIRHSETLQKLNEIKTLFSPLYKDLNSRVKNLEERAERQTRDVIDVIRERFGKH